MSIIANLEYLLGVAEKIIDNCADPQTITKYYSLKEKLTFKYKEVTQQSLFTLGNTDNQSNHSACKLKYANTMEQSKWTKRENSRQSVGKSSSKKLSKELQRGRAETFDSQKTVSGKKKHQNFSGQMILTQVATILKNAEACPQLLKTIKFTFDGTNQSIYNPLLNIGCSLQHIYRTLVQQKSDCDDPLKSSTLSDELLVDNRWLISKLQSLIIENTTLRRMIGQSKPYF